VSEVRTLLLAVRLVRSRRNKEDTGALGRFTLVGCGEVTAPNERAGNSKPFVAQGLCALT